MEKSWIKHKCSKESENALIEFLKTAKAHKTNAFCDLNKYEIWRSFIEEDIDLEQNLKDDHVIECFCNCILFKMMLTVFDEDIKIFFLQFCERFKEVVRKQVIISINNNDHLDILLLYLNSLKPTMQEEILRELLRNQNIFQKVFISI
ncbi:hypothetical protein HHI36_002465 [Cryptolaemus montrouzieri]|uniref:Uncharacterized protein n=1 Tax=Cryptolaemus montrouzieri TaxID=559131 RepID=A0ABD2PAS3_9CUCU